MNGRGSNMGAFWLPEEDALVKRLWISGASASEIARAMSEKGFVRGRCAVLGRVHRLGLARTGRGKASRPERDERARRNGAIKGVIAKSVMSKAPPTLRVVAPVEPADMADAVSEVIADLADALRTPEAGGAGGVSLVALSSGQCRGPRGEGRAGEALFCGAPVRGFRQSYCEACHKALHAPKPQSRQIDRSFNRQAVRNGW